MVMRCLMEFFVTERGKEIARRQKEYTEEIIKSVEQENKNLKITALHAVGDPANKAGRIIVIKFSTSLKSCFGMGVLQ